MNETDQYPVYAVEVFQYYYTPILVHLGTMGNCLSIYVILKTKLRKLSSSHYLVALAASDTVFLCTIFAVWLRMNDIDIFNKPILCQTFVYLAGVSSCLSVWLVMAFTAERFVAVMYPLKSKILCTVSRAKLIILSLLIVTLLVYSPQLIFADAILHVESNKTICDVRFEWQNEAYIFNIFDSIATFVVPMVVITVLNAYISKNIWKFSDIRRKMTMQKQVEGREQRVKSRGSKTSHNLTKMLLIVSTVCLAMNLPSYILRIVAGIIEAEVITLSPAKRLSFMLMQQLSLILFNTTFGINFALYCISGQNFRKAVASVFRCKHADRRDISPTPENRTQSTASSGSKKRRTPTRWSDQEFAI